MGLSLQQRAFARRTVSEYRAYCQALTGVVMTHWPQIANAKSQAGAVEALTHRTKKNPSPKYAYFSRRFHKFPSYLRRAAIRFVIGQVSSYLTRYDAWQAGERKFTHERQPRLEVAAKANPCLYRGQMMKWGERYETVELKLFDGREWLWRRAPIRRRGRRDPNLSKLLNPTLLAMGKRVWLSVPHKLDNPTSPRWEDPTAGKALGVDLGINKSASMAVVDRAGTVTYRGFIHPGADMDQRDKLLDAIRKKASLTGKLHEGFCKNLYRRAASLNTEIARKTARGILDTATRHGVRVIVFEHLQGFRPKGGRYRSSLRKRFHTWLHRLVHRIVTEQAEELGVRVVTVNPRGTSKYAFDGSGLVRRDPQNAAVAKFTTGKRYDADLNAAYNIAAKHHYYRYWRAKHPQLEKSPTERGGQGNRDEAHSGRRPGRAPRTPVTLSTLWRLAEGMAEGEAPPTLAKAS